MKESAFDCGYCFAKEIFIPDADRTQFIFFRNAQLFRDFRKKRAFSDFRCNFLLSNTGFTAPDRKNKRFLAV